MSRRRSIAAFAILTVALAASAPAHDPSGVHDFDFTRGTWNAHHRVLKERLAGSTTWTEFDGIVTQRPLMDGWANSGDNVFRMPSGEVRGVSLRAYDAKSGEWAVWWVDGRNPLGKVDPPMKGRFENGVGRFYSNDSLRGKPIRVRVVWTRPTPNTAHWEQAYSADGGKSWEVNWITDFTRPADSTTTVTAKATSADDPDGANAFDLRVGTWKIHHRVLKDRLAGSTEWLEYDGTQRWWSAIGGAGNVDDNVFMKPGGEFKGVTVRAYDAKTRQWAIWWLDGRTPFGKLDPPIKGTFVNGIGTFYAADSLRGKPIEVRFIWSRITPTSAHWEQAFSPDSGKSWETNWISDFTRAEQLR